METKLAIVDELVTVYGRNRELIDEKLRSYRQAQWAFVSSVGLLAIAILIRLAFLTGVPTK